MFYQNNDGTIIIYHNIVQWIVEHTQTINQFYCECNIVTRGSNATTTAVLADE